MAEIVRQSRSEASLEADTLKFDEWCRELNRSLDVVWKVVFNRQVCVLVLMRLQSLRSAPLAPTRERGWGRGGISLSLIQLLNRALGEESELLALLDAVGLRFWCNGTDLFPAPRFPRTFYSSLDVGHSQRLGKARFRQFSLGN